MSKIIPKFPMIAFCAVGISVFILAINLLPYQGVDLLVLYRAGRGMIDGHNPYSMNLKFYTPVWSLLLLTPMSLLSFRVCQFIWTLCSLNTWILVMRKLQIKPLDMAIFMLNPFFIYGLALGSYDWLALVGILLPMEIGAWFLVLKPQITIGLLFEWMNRHGISKAVRAYFLPGLALAISILLGAYRSPNLSEMWWNWSLGLLGVPVGLALMWFAFKGKDSALALSASPFLSPYVGIQSWSLAMLMLTRKRAGLCAGVILSWLIVALKHAA